MSRSSFSHAKNTDDLHSIRRHKDSILKSEDHTEMGKRIKAIRTKRGMTIEQAAERLGVHENSVKQYERGKSLTFDNILRICCGYGCTVAEILPDEFIRYTSPFESALCDTGERKLVSIRSELDRVSQRRIAMER